MYTNWNIFNTIERHIKKYGIHDNFSKSNMRRLGDFGLISHLQQDVNLFEPWATGLVQGYQKPKEEIERWWNDSRVQLLALKKALSKIEMPSSWIPCNNRYKCPDSLGSEKWTKLMIKAEKHLDEDWQAVEKAIFARFRKTSTEMFEKDFQFPNQGQRTQPWNCDFQEVVAEDIINPTSILVVDEPPLPDNASPGIDSVNMVIPNDAIFVFDTAGIFDEDGHSDSKAQGLIGAASGVYQVTCSNLIKR